MTSPCFGDSRAKEWRGGSARFFFCSTTAAFPVGSASSLSRNLVQSESNQEALRWLSSQGGTEVGEVMSNPNEQNPGQQQGGQDKPGQQQGGGGQQKPGQQQQEPGKGGQQGGQGGQRQGGQEQNR
jgi:hypothetical protein